MAAARSRALASAFLDLGPGSKWIHGRDPSMDVIRTL
jgi:hypothetical protein